ncbi:hypothetical protein IE81DRAFT_282198, partial [Ceraceosorus guamensis]
IAIRGRTGAAFPPSGRCPPYTVHGRKGPMCNTSDMCGTNIVASGTDSGLEAFSHYPAGGSFAPLPD